MKTVPIHSIDASKPMELILRPTERCNFKCTYCSSTYITDSRAEDLDHKYVFDFLTRFPATNTLIINGGDGLMVKPEYYWKIIAFLDEHNMPASISFTSNLWAFYKKPSMWTELFKHPRVGVTTSFEYGGGRMVTTKIPYTEKMFWNVSNSFLEHIGYRPDFISVITDENEHTALDNVYLAKEMGVENKLNYAMASGAQSSPYQLSKIYKTYVEIYDKGLMPWEYNTKQMAKRLRANSTTCPQNRSCDSHIRALNPNGEYYSCGAFGDDRDHPIDFQQEIYENKFFTPVSDDANLVSLKQECLTCPMFDICNGCRKTVKDMKEHGIVEQHCKLMKALAPRILEINFHDRPEELQRRLDMV